MRTYAWLLVALTACAAEPDVSVTNVGHGCAWAWLPGLDPTTDVAMYDHLWGDQYGVGAFATNQPALLWVSTTAAPCATDGIAHCDVEVHGHEIVLESSASWNLPTQACVTREAPPELIAMCKTPLLDEGNYSIAFGSATATFAVPADSSLTPCFRSE